MALTIVNDDILMSQLLWVIADCDESIVEVMEAHYDDDADDDVTWEDEILLWADRLFAASIIRCWFIKLALWSIYIASHVLNKQKQWILALSSLVYMHDNSDTWYAVS